MFVLAVGVKGYMAFRVSCVSIFGLLSERRGRQPRKSLHWRFSIFFLDLLSINQFRSRIELPTPSKKKEKPRKEKNKQIKETEEKEMGPLRRIRFLILWYNNNITARVRRMNREQVLPASHRLVKLFETVLRAYIITAYSALFFPSFLGRLDMYSFRIVRWWAYGQGRRNIPPPV
jgi:hypothetical protein